MRLFTEDEQLIAISVDALRIIALAQPFQAIGQVLAGSLRGAGDTRFPMYATAGSIWFVRLPLAWLLGPYFHLSLAFIYVSNIVDSIVRLWALWLRYRQGKWRSMKV